MISTKRFVHTAAIGLVLASSATAIAGGGGPTWTSPFNRTKASLKAKPQKPALNLKVELDNEVRMANKRQTAIIKLGLTGNEQDGDRPPVNLAIVLDRSGSMTGEKLEKAKEAAIAAVNRMGRLDKVSVVIYAHIVETIVPAQAVSNKDDIIARINAISPTQGNTALFAGISLAAHEIRKNAGDSYIHRIVLLSDGKANAGPSSVTDLGRLGIALQKEDISITTVGLGNGYDEEIMTVLAERTDGNTYFARKSADLPDIFDAEIGDVMSVVAKDVDINVDIPDGFKPLRIVGRSGKIDGQNVQLSMNQVNFGQEKYALVEVELPAGIAADLTTTNVFLDIANAEVNWKNPWNGMDENASGVANVRFTEDAQQVLTNANRGVIVDFYANSVEAANDYAVELTGEGKNMQAAQVLYENAATIRADGVANHDESMVKQADELEKQAEIVQKGLTEEQKKSMRAKSWQIRNQQEYLAH